MMSISDGITFDILLLVLCIVLTDISSILYLLLRCVDERFLV